MKSTLQCLIFKNFTSDGQDRISKSFV